MMLWRILGWLTVPYIMIFIDWKHIKRFLSPATHNNDTSYQSSAPSQTSAQPNIIYHISTNQVKEELAIVGVTFENDDGKNRQDILRKCKNGMDIELIRTPMRKYPNAIGVFTKYGQIGNIAEIDNAQIAKSMDAGHPILNAKIKKLIGGTRDKPTLGCIITFSWTLEK